MLTVDRLAKLQLQNVPLEDAVDGARSVDRKFLKVVLLVLPDVLHQLNVLAEGGPLLGTIRTALVASSTHPDQGFWIIGCSRICRDSW